MNVLTERWHGDVVVLELSGPFTYEAGARLTAWVGNAPRAKVLLNLAGVSYLDSAGLGSLIAAYRATTRQGGVLKLLEPTPRVRHLFHITGLLSFFETFESEAAAVASFGAAEAVTVP